jgi:hypothetical protein
MAAVRRGMRVEPGKLSERSSVRPPTDVMAITSLPEALGQHAVLTLPQGMHSPDTLYSILDTLGEGLKALSYFRSSLR